MIYLSAKIFLRMTGPERFQALVIVLLLVIVIAVFRRIQTVRPTLKALQRMSFSNSSSPITFTPSLRALSSFEPGDSPATT